MPGHESVELAYKDGCFSFALTGAKNRAILLTASSQLYELREAGTFSSTECCAPHAFIQAQNGLAKTRLVTLI
jgi:hypothetical protein